MASSEKYQYGKIFGDVLMDAWCILIRCPFSSYDLIRACILVHTTMHRYVHDVINRGAFYSMSFFCRIESSSKSAPCRLNSHYLIISDCPSPSGAFCSSIRFESSCISHLGHSPTFLVYPHPRLGAFCSRYLFFVSIFAPREQSQLSFSKFPSPFSTSHFKKNKDETCYLHHLRLINQLDRVGKSMHAFK